MKRLKGIALLLLASLIFMNVSSCRNLYDNEIDVIEEEDKIHSKGNTHNNIKNNEKEDDVEMTKDIMDKSYADKAEWAEKMLIEYYWNESEKFMNNTYPLEKDEGHLNYWWKAHAVDAMVDGYERTGEERYLHMAEEIIKGIIERNGSLFNEFYDDMEWLALSSLRLYDVTGDEIIKGYVLELWEDIKNAWWEDELGGMAWKKEDNNRNTCSNGPASILASRLYVRFGDKEDLEYAKKIHAWIKKNLVDKDTGIVWDGLAVLEDGTIDVNKDWIFTYGQGTYIGAGVELYKATGDDQYLKDAEKTAAATLDKLADFSTGILRDEGQGDGGLFKGILIRYLANLYEINRDLSIKEMINHNSDTLVSISYSDGLFGTSWDQRRPMPLDLSTQLSGVFLLEGAAKIEKLDIK